MTEQWLPIYGHEGRYEVSDDGRVRSTGAVRQGGRILTPGVNNKGYLTVSIGSNGNRKTERVHRLVAEAFHAEGQHEGDVVRHLDGDKSNNSACNLAWGTPSENEMDKVGHGLHPHARKTHCPKGHPYDDANTRNYKGMRRCRSCTSADLPAVCECGKTVNRTSMARHKRSSAHDHLRAALEGEQQ